MTCPSGHLRRKTDQREVDWIRPARTHPARSVHGGAADADGCQPSAAARRQRRIWSVRNAAPSHKRHTRATAFSVTDTARTGASYRAHRGVIRRYRGARRALLELVPHTDTAHSRGTATLSGGTIGSGGSLSTFTDEQKTAEGPSCRRPTDTVMWPRHRPDPPKPCRTNTGGSVEIDIRQEANSERVTRSLFAADGMVKARWSRPPRGLCPAVRTMLNAGILLMPSTRNFPIRQLLTGTEQKAPL